MSASTVSEPAPRGGAVLLAVVVGWASTVVGVWFEALTRPADARTYLAEPALLSVQVLAVLVTSGVALATVSKAPPMSRWLGLLSAALGGNVLLMHLGAWMVSDPGPPSDLAVTMAQLSTDVFSVPMLVLVITLSLFPDGRPPTAWVRPALRLAIAVTFASLVVDMLLPEPVDPPFAPLARAWVLPALGGPLAPVQAVLAVAWVVLTFGLAPAALIARWRRSNTAVRRQIRWVLLAAAALPVVIGGCVALNVGLHTEALLVRDLGFNLIFIGFGLALGMAMLYRDLYDVDRAISRAITYVTVTVTATVAFLAAAALTAKLAERLTGRPGSAVAAALGAATVVLIWRPVYRRVNDWSERTFDRERYAAVAAIRAAAASARRTLDPAASIRDALREAWRDPQAEPLFQIPGQPDLSDADGVGPPSPHQHRTRCSHRYGSVAARSARSSTANASRSVTLLRSTLDEAGLLYENAALEVALRAQAHATATAVAAGRDAADTARRRLERDLHDGVQGRLVAVALDLAATREEHPMSTVDATIGAAVTQLQTAINELRQLAHGVYPAALLGTGLGDAIRSYASGCPYRFWSTWTCPAYPPMPPRRSTSPPARRSPTPANTPAPPGSTFAPHGTTQPSR